MDDAETPEALAALLEKHGYHVVPAATAAKP